MNLLDFHIPDYQPPKDAAPLFAISRLIGGRHIGIHRDGVKKVWGIADHAATHRARIEQSHPELELYVIKIDARGQMEEVSWPKPAPVSIQTPGAGTW